MTFSDFFTLEDILQCVSDSPKFLLVVARPVGLLLGVLVVWWLVGSVIALFRPQRTEGGDS